MPYGVLAVGHPDPRENARGGQSELDPLLSKGHQGAQEFTLQQNELVMRGMAQIEEDFLLQVILTPVSMQNASRMLAGLAEYTSTWAAWQTGQPLLQHRHLAPADALRRDRAQRRHRLHRSRVGRAERMASRTWTARATRMAGRSPTPKELAVTDGIARTHTEGRAVTDSHSESNGQSAGSNWGAERGFKAGTWADRSGVPGVASVNGGYNDFSSQSAGGFASDSHAVTDGQCRHPTPRAIP